MTKYTVCADGLIDVQGDDWDDIGRGPLIWVLIVEASVSKYLP